MSSKRVSNAEPRDDAKESDKAWIRKQTSVPDLFPRSSLSQASIISMPTVTKDIATKYHSRPPLSVPTPTPTSTPTPAASPTPSPTPTPAASTATVTATDPSTTKDTAVTEKEQQRPSQLDAQGQMATKKVTSKVADKIRDILSGRVAGNVTATITKRKEVSMETPTNQSRSSVEAKVATDTSAAGQEDVLVGRPLSSAADDMATLSSPRIPSVVVADYNDGQRPADFPQPFYSTLGRYKPHEPGDEAFSPITLAMTLEPDEGKRGSLKRPTLLIRRTISSEKLPSKTSLTLHAAAAAAGAASPKGRVSKTVQVHATESETGSEAESVASSAMMQSVVSIMKFMSQTGAQARESAARLSVEPAAAAAGGTSVAGADAAPVGLKPSTDHLAPAGSMTEDEMEALRLSVRAMVGLQRWKKRANTRLSQRAGPHVTVKTYAKNTKHNMILQKNIEDLATQLPLPLLKTLRDEAFPILNDILHAYERTLGKTNPLTEQAKTKVESMATFIKTYDEM